MQQREIQEAINACDQVLSSIDEARRELSSAKNWGIFDILGGGLFASLIKHGKMSRAEAAMARIQSDLRLLQRELRDVSQAMAFNFTAQDLNMFLDIAFDNIFSDLLSQSKISHALTELSELEQDVTGLQIKLRQLAESRR